MVYLQIAEDPQAISLSLKPLVAMQLYPAVDPEVAAAAAEKELQADEWNLGELERRQQEQVRL